MTLRKALDVARDQQAKSWELRAATTLARLLASRGDRAEALALLTPIHGWFTESRDTKDVKEADDFYLSFAIPRPCTENLRRTRIIFSTDSSSHGRSIHLDFANDRSWRWTQLVIATL
jgi:hypothetical protein